MSALSARSALVAASAAALLLAALTACAPEAATETPATDSSESSEEATTDDTSTDSAFVTLPGTGSYAIGTEAPYGGYQLVGEPDAVPAGCTWSIVDADGAVAFADEGLYVFLTDIPEAVTFITDGCPDWEQFE